MFSTFFTNFPPQCQLLLRPAPALLPPLPSTGTLGGSTGAPGRARPSPQPRACPGPGAQGGDTLGLQRGPPQPRGTRAAWHGVGHREMGRITGGQRELGEPGWSLGTAGAAGAVPGHLPISLSVPQHTGVLQGHRAWLTWHGAHLAQRGSTGVPVPEPTGGQGDRGTGECAGAQTCPGTPCRSLAVPRPLLAEHTAVFIACWQQPAPSLSLSHRWWLPCWVWAPCTFPVPVTPPVTDLEVLCPCLAAKAWAWSTSCLLHQPPQAHPAHPAHPIPLAHPTLSVPPAPLSHPVRPAQPQLGGSAPRHRGRALPSGDTERTRPPSSRPPALPHTPGGGHGIAEAWNHNIREVLWLGKPAKATVRPQRCQTHN